MISAIAIEGEKRPQEVFICEQRSPMRYQVGLVFQTDYQRLLPVIESYPDIIQECIDNKGCTVDNAYRHMLCDKSIRHSPAFYSSRKSYALTTNINFNDMHVESVTLKKVRENGIEAKIYTENALDAAGFKPKERAISYLNDLGKVFDKYRTPLLDQRYLPEQSGILRSDLKKIIRCEEDSSNSTQNLAKEFLGDQEEPIQALRERLELYPQTLPQTPPMSRSQSLPRAAGTVHNLGLEKYAMKKNITILYEDMGSGLIVSNLLNRRSMARSNLPTRHFLHAYNYCAVLSALQNNGISCFSNDFAEEVKHTVNAAILQHKMSLNKA